MHWVAETSNPPDMINHGWSKSSLKVGDQVTVTVIPVKNGKPIGRIAAVVLPNGQTLDGGFGAISDQAGPMEELRVRRANVLSGSAKRCSMSGCFDGGMRMTNKVRRFLRS